MCPTAHNLFINYMAHKQIYLAPKKKEWADQFKPETLRGGILRPSAGTAAEYQRAMLKITEQMVRETQKEIYGLFMSPVFDINDVESRIAREEGVLTEWAETMDASIGSQARILMNKLQRRFQVLFNEAATDATRKMVERSLANSATSLKTSLKDMAGNVTLSTDIFTGGLDDVVTASTAFAVNLFKSIPTRYLGDVSNSVLSSITTGRGLQDLIPEMEKQVETHGIKIKNWAKNTALDQTRKVYNSVNAGRMQAIGVKQFQWVHSGGSNDPRQLHIDHAPTGLNGGIFSFDNPPVIGVMYGAEVRGLPGDLPNCHCTMRPVFTFDDDDE